VNLSALVPSLIESELFGHSKGAFTNATSQREGYFGRSQSSTCIFLDEIGELDLAIQVTLLRVLQSREFQRVGETNPQTFHGKIIAATNRNLSEEMGKGRFREDFYYRLCADIIHTPSLRQQLVESPEDLEMLVSLMTREVIKGDPEEADGLTREVVDWIRQHLGENYDWPGNFRELSQCIRNVMIRGYYTPSPRCDSGVPDNPRRQLAEAVANAEWSLPEVVRHYQSLVYALEGTYESAGQRLGINWRTVKDKVSPDLVERYQDSP
jgi:transcriptional regulator with GAF, ATPase, and Fis domain